MTEIIKLPELTKVYPPEASDRFRVIKDMLNSIFAAFNRDGKAVMLADSFDNDVDALPHFITFRYAGSKRIGVQIRALSDTVHPRYIMFGVLAESAPDDTPSLGHLLRKYTDTVSIPNNTDPRVLSAIINVTTSDTGIVVTYRITANDEVLNTGTLLTGYTAKHMITGDRVMLIDDMLPGSDVAVASSTTQGIAIPRPSTLLAPQSDIMYSIPIINPSGDDAGFTGYFADGKFAFSNIHQYPVGTTVSIEGKLYSVVGTNYIAPLED